MEKTAFNSDSSRSYTQEMIPKCTLVYSFTTLAVSIPGSVYISYPMFIEPTITWVPSGFSGYIWLDTKIVF